MQRGAGKFGLLMGIVAVAALAVCIVGWSTRAPAHVDTAKPAAESHLPARDPFNTADDEPFVARLEKSTPEGERPPAAYPAELFDPKRYEGTAHLRVFATVKPGAQFPREWSLEFEPSKTLIGGEHAVARRFDFKNGETSLEVDDIALGGYDIRASAAGMCSMLQQQFFSKPDNVDVVLRIELYPAGFLSGRIIDARERPVDGVPVVLESATDHARREVLADPAGAYVFETLLDGDYLLFAGSADSPLAAPREVAFLAPSLHMPDIVVPVLGEVAVHVTDVSGAPVADAKVEGYGNAGGRLSGQTDARGRAVARFLPAGKFTFVVTAANGAVGREQFELEAGARGEVRIRVRD